MIGTVAAVAAVALTVGAVLVAAADATSNVFIVASGLSIAVGLITFLVKELRQSSSGAWRVVRAGNRELHRARWELETERYWRDVAETDLRIERGVVPQGTLPSRTNPGQYREPTEEELKQWA